MHILVMHFVPDSSVRYGDCIDHDVHDVTYVTTSAKRRSLPQGVRRRVVERPGTADLAAEVLAAVSQLPPPDAVVALAESDIIAAGEVRDALGVTGPKRADAVLVRDKVRMKSAVAAAGLRVPRFLSLATTDRECVVTWQGSTVLKPSTGAGSDGVVIHPSVTEALEAARQRDPVGATGALEIEEFVPGAIIHIDGVMADAKPVVLLPGRYVNTCLDFANGAPFGSVQFLPDADLISWTLRCLEAVGISDGPFHLEAIESPDGLTFMEVGARPPGRGSVDTFELATGVRLSSLAVRLAIDGPDRLPVARTPAADGLYGFFVYPRHRLHDRRLIGASRFRSDPIVHRWFERRPHQLGSPTFTYTPQHAPLGGLLGPASEARMTQYLANLFGTVRVDHRNGAG